MDCVNVGFERNQKTTCAISVLERMIQGRPVEENDNHNHDDYMLPGHALNEIIELEDEFVPDMEKVLFKILSCSNNLYDKYHGLDASKDPKELLETALRLFPNVLSTKGCIVEDLDEGHLNEENSEKDASKQYYPIQVLPWSGVNAVSFIPTLAKVANEFGQFGREDRGGLLLEDENGNNVLQKLAMNDSSKKYRYHEFLDDCICEVFKELRNLGLFTEDDIQKYKLLHFSSIHEKYFPKKRFQFLLQLDPNALQDLTEYGQTPLHLVAQYSTIQGFQSVLKFGFQYFGKKKGISTLFQTDKDNYTPFKLACNHYGIEQAMSVINSVLNTVCFQNDDETYDHNMSHKFLLSAAVNENIHIDGVYYVLQREPDLLKKILPFTCNGIGGI